MHHFPRRDRNEDREAIERFERRSENSNDAYFDVHQIEIIFEYYIEKADYTRAMEAIDTGLNQHPMSTALMIRKATLLMDSGDFLEAKSILLLLSKIESNDPDVFIHLGSIFLYESNLEEGLKYLKRAHFLGAEHGDEYGDLISDICNQLNFYGYHKETIEYINSLEPQFRKNRNVDFEYGLANENLMFFDEALLCYNKLIDEDPFLENVWYNIGNCYNKDNKFDEAIEAYLYTLAINPNNTEAIFNLANCYAQLSRYDEALDCYLDHISFIPIAESVYPYIADCYERLGNYEYAFRFYKLIADKNILNSEGHAGMGNCYYEFKNFKAALKSFKTALELAPDSGDIWFSIGKCYLSQGKIKSAIKAYRKAIELNEHDTAAWFELYFLRHEITGKDFEKIFAKLDLFENENSSLYYLCVVIWLEQKNAENALSALQKGFFLNPEDIRILVDYYPEVLNEPILANFINENSEPDEF